MLRGQVEDSGMVPGTWEDRMKRRKTTPRPAQDAHSIESLTQISIDLFMRRGYEGTSVEEIASAAGITKSAIYYHVSSKEELLRRAISSAVSQLFNILGQPGARDGTPMQRLEHIVRQLVEIEIGYLKEIALLLRVRGTTETELWALEQRREFDRHVRALIVEAQRAGEVRDDFDALAIARLMFGMLNWIPEWYHERHVIAPAVLVEAAVALVFDGIRKPPAGRSPG